MNTITVFPLRRLGALLLALLLAGCASLVRTPYSEPDLKVPSTWQHTSDGKPVATAPWWQAFGDTQLNALVDEVLAHNADLAAAGIKLKRAQLNTGLTEDAFMPALGASAGNNLSKSLKGDGTVTRSYSATATLSWEADLWGKLASTRDAAQWEALASEQDKANTALSLIGSTAKLYWQIAYLNQRLSLAAQSIAYSENTLTLAQRKFAAGAVTRLDVLQAEQDLASQRASQSQLIQQREEARTAFALLFDGPPHKDFTEPSTLPAGTLPGIAADLPASLLAQRPDLRAAELRLRSTLASGDATRLSYYPSLSLTGSLGSSSDKLRDVLSNPVAALASELALPFLQQREMRLKTGVAQADYQLAVIQFRQAFYTALGDVENALSARTQNVQQGQWLAQSLANAAAAEKINAARYRAGAIPLQTWLDSQEKRRSAESALAENRYNQLTSQITVNLALGGSMAND
ncbi:MAG: efflux system, outer rane lipoprotein [Proteobacteria bacterium]|nr:efflux system, outer rane lipoprotein [Pseudomonadota bacterium]